MTSGSSRTPPQRVICSVYSFSERNPMLKTLLLPSASVEAPQPGSARSHVPRVPCIRERQCTGRQILCSISSQSLSTLRVAFVGQSSKAEFSYSSSMSSRGSTPSASASLRMLSMRDPPGYCRYHPQPHRGAPTPRALVASVDAIANLPVPITGPHRLCQQIHPRTHTPMDTRPSTFSSHPSVNKSGRDRRLVFVREASQEPRPA